MSVKTFDFLKIQNSKLLVCEIRPVKCSIDTSAGRLKTTKWMNYQHWKELRFLLKSIAEEYEAARNSLKVAEDIKHGKPQTKISDSIKIAYMWALNKECCRHFLTPRKDTCWSDSEDDPISLNDKGGRYKSLQACGDMLVVSVALLNEAEIQHKNKRSKNLQELQSQRATSESAVSSQYLDRSLYLALDPTLVQETPNISEYFSTQNQDNKSPSNSNLDESQKIKPRISASKIRTSENVKKSQLQQPVLQVEDIENTKKKTRSFFDTDSSSSTEVPLKPSSSISSDSQAESAASKIFKKVSAVEFEFENLINNKYDVKDTATEIKGITIKKENISNKDYSPQKNSTNYYAQKKSECSFSVPLVGLDHIKKSFLLNNIKEESFDSPDDSRERSGSKSFQSSCSRETPRISSPVEDICSETPESYLKVGKSPTLAKMNIDNSIDLHTELIASNKLEIYPLDLGSNEDQTFTRKFRQIDLETITNYDQAESMSVNKNLNKILPDSRKNNKIATEYSDTSCISINNYLRIQTENVQNSSESDLIGKFIKRENLFTETDRNSEQETQKNQNLISSIEIRKKRKTKKERGTRNRNLEMKNKIPTKDLDNKFAVVEDEEQERNDRKDNSTHSLKPHENQKTKYIKSFSESEIGNECSYLIPHTTEEITDQKLYDFETEEFDNTTKNVSDSSQLPVSFLTGSERVTKITKILEEPDETYISSACALITNNDQSSSPRKRGKKKMQIGNEISDESSTQNYCKIRTRSKSIDVFGMATSSPDLFEDNYDKTEDQDKAVANMFNPGVEIDVETETMEEDIYKEFASQEKDLGNIHEQYISTSHILSGTPEKLTSTTCKLPNLEFSPILKNRAIKRKNKHRLNSSLQRGSKRLKISKRNCNTQIFDNTNKKDSVALVKDLRKDSKKKDQIQESKYNNDEIFDIEHDIFEFSNSSIQSRKTLDEIMKSNNREDGDDIDGDGDDKDDDDKDDDDKDDDDKDDDDKHEYGNDSNDDDYDLPDLGSEQNNEVCINATEILDDVSGDTIEHVLTKRDKNIHQNNKFESVMDILSSSSKICKRNEYSRGTQEIYIPPDCPKASDKSYSPTPISLLHSNEPKISNVSNSEETNNLSLEGTLDSAESPDARRSQRIQSKKHCKRESCCSGCENSSQNSPRKIKKKFFKPKSKESPNENNDLNNIQISSNVKGKEKNKKNREKSNDELQKNDIFNPPNSQETTSEKNNGSNIVCAKENFILGQLDSTQALLDCEFPDEWECDSSKVKPMAKTQKAQAEFEKIRKNFKSRKKKQNTDITLYMDSCQVSKTAKEVRPMHRKPQTNRKKLKETNLPKNQSKLNSWIKKDSKQSNPTVDEEPKASGSKEFENTLYENESLYKQKNSKSKKNGQKGMKSTNDSKSDNFNLSSEQNCELHAYEDDNDMEANESERDKDNINIEPLKKKAIELEETTNYNPVPSVGDDSRLYTCGPSEQLDSSVQITHEEKCPNQSEKASLIARGLEVISCAELETLVTQHLPYLGRVAKGGEDNERHAIYMQGGAAARCNTPEVIFAPFTDEQLEHVHSVLRNTFLKKLQKNNIEGKEYLWMVLVPTFLIKLVMYNEEVSFEVAEELFKHMAFPKRPSRDSLGFGDPW